MKTKRVRFDFYSANRIISPKFDKKAQAVADKVKKYEHATQWYGKHQYNKYTQKLNELQLQQAAAQTGAWNISVLVNYACQNDIQITLRVSSGDLLEIDKTTLYQHEDDLVTFQVTTLRSHDIPAKKKLGQARANVELDDDEFLGEFTQVIYDTRFHTVAIQSTKHGASYKAIEALLNEIDRQMNPERVEIGTFEPIVNPDVINRVNNSGKYRRLSIRCSDASYPHGQMAAHFSNALSYISPDAESWTMELSINFTGANHDHALAPARVQEMVRSFQEVQANPLLTQRAKDDYGVDVTYYDEHADKYVTVDLLVPKLHFFIDVEMEARKVIGSQYMYELVTEAYRTCEGRLAEIMRHRV